MFLRRALRGVRSPPGPLAARFRPLSTFDPQNGANQQQNQQSDSQGSRGSAALESALGTMAGIVLLAGTGIGYHYWYKKDVLDKMYHAFAAGYDPVLELARASSESNGGRIKRIEQEFIDSVLDGKVVGEYLLLLGPKGVGKTTLLVEAMLKNDADGVAMMEGHEDPEVFRLRLGKCLEFEFNEDSFAGLFQRKDPREAGPLLDIERALNKLEKVAIRFRKERGRPLILIFNNIHFVHDDEDGHSLLHMLQQRAESWAAAGVCTMVFTSDDFHPYRHLKKSATRMRVLTVKDLTPFETHTFLSNRIAANGGPPLDPSISKEVWNLLGGRLSLLGKLTEQPDMIEAAKEMIESEKSWLLHHLGLIPDHDDDVMDEQKVSTCSFLLFQEFVRLAEEEDAMEDLVALDSTPLDEIDAIPNIPKEAFPSTLELKSSVMSQAEDPRMSWGRARVVMTRPDFISVPLDRQHMVNIDVNHVVRPDSRLMLNVFRSIVAEEGFQEELDSVRARVDEIESLHRTAELTVKRGSADLGGFLRMRVGRYGKEHEKKEDDEEEGAGVDSEVEEPEVVRLA